MEDAELFQPAELITSQRSHIYTWEGGRLSQYDDTADNLALLTVLKPYYDQNLKVLAGSTDRSADFSDFIGLSCSKFVDPSLNFCQENAPGNSNLTGGRGNTGDADVPVWDLGSNRCYSQYPKVCDLLLQTRSSSECGDLGCGEMAVSDPEQSTCVALTATTARPYEHEGPEWQSQPLCDYYSRCEAVRRGYIKASDLNCYCDEFCVYFNDCCVDAPYQATNDTRIDSDIFSCRSLGFRNITDFKEWGVTMVDNCPRETPWSPVERCESSQTPFDVPVTDPRTGLV